MSQLINTKELCKQIRYSGKFGSVVWTREKSQDFISNRHFLVRFESVPNDVLAALFGEFYKLPEVGQTMQSFHGDIRDGKPINYSGIYMPEKQDVVGETTSYLRDFGNKLIVRVIKFPSHYSLINENYMKLAADSDEKPKTKGDSPHAPVYMAGGNLILLPYRTTDSNQFLDDLLGADKQESHRSGVS